MSREIRSKEEITHLIREEMRKHEQCAHVSLSSVYWHEPDATGCNWSFSFTEGRTDDIPACASCIQEATKGIRTRYNIPHEE